MATQRSEVVAVGTWAEIDCEPFRLRDGSNGDPSGMRVLSVPGACAGAPAIAVPFAGMDGGVAWPTGVLPGKALVHADGALGRPPIPLDPFTLGGPAALQAQAPEHLVVDAIDAVLTQQLIVAQLAAAELTAVIAREAAAATRAQMFALAHRLGFEPATADSLRNARLIKPIASLTISGGGVLRVSCGLGAALLRV